MEGNGSVSPSFSRCPFWNREKCLLRPRAAQHPTPTLTRGQAEPSALSRTRVPWKPRNPAAWTAPRGSIGWCLSLQSLQHCPVELSVRTEMSHIRMIQYGSCQSHFRCGQGT